MSLTQKQLDKEMVESGKSRYWKFQNLAIKGEREADTDYGIRLLNASVYPVAEALRQEYKTIGKAGYNNTGVKALMDSGIDPEVLALLAIQSVLDGVSKQQRASRVMSVIGRRIVTESLLCRLAADQPFLLKTLKQWTADPQSELRRRATIKKIAANTSEDMRKVVAEATIDDALLLRMGWVLVELMRRHTGLIDVKNVTQSATKTTTWIVPTEETLQWIRAYGEKCELLRPVKLPMVVPPYDWSSPSVGGYANDLGEDLIRTESGLVVACATKEQMPVVYRVINAMQKVPLKVNSLALEVVDKLWDNGVVFGDLPNKEDKPSPPRPEGDGKDPVIKMWRREVHRIHEQNRTESGRRINFAQTIALARRFQGMNIFSPLCMDFRGRLYPQISYLSYQGTDVGKGLVSFALGKKIAVGSQEWVALMLGGSNHAGIKGSLKTRLFETEKLLQTGVVQAIVKDPLEHKSLWIDRDEPIQFLSWCEDVVNVIAGKPSCHPVWQDASCNGLQIISLLLRDDLGGRLTNCTASTPNDLPQDIYGEVAKRTVALLHAETDPAKKAWAKEWIAYGVDRGCVKRCVMIVPYNGTMHAGVHYIREWYDERYLRIGGPWKECAHPVGYLTTVVWKAIHEIITRGMEFMSWMRQVGKLCNENGIQPSWITPSGFFVHQQYWQYDACMVKTTLGRTVRMFQLRKPSKRVATRKHLNALAPNYIHSLDAAAEVLTFDALRSSGIDMFLGQHDSYGCLAADSQAVSSTIRKTWSSMFSDDLLSMFIKHVAHELPRDVVLPALPSYGTLNPSEILKSTYFFS